VSIVDVCVRRPVFATMLVVSLVVLGLASYRNLGLDLFPKVDLPTVTITTRLPGASPEEIESQITKKVEEVVNTVNGIDEMRSTTIEGQSQVFVTSIFGMFLLMGVVKKNAILQVDYTNVLRARGMPRFEAQMEADKARLRPILMTTLAIIFGMLPIALGRGDGAASRAALAVTVVGGQALCLLITLLVTPVVYSLFDDLRGRRVWRRLRPSRWGGLAGGRPRLAGSRRGP